MGAKKTMTKSRSRRTSTFVSPKNSEAQSQSTKTPRLNLRFSPKDYELLQARSHKAGMSMQKYMIDRFHSTKQLVVPEINQDAILLLRKISEQLREQSIAIPEIQAALNKVMQIALGRNDC
jgi:uncharacterized protein (DUF1778 family)